MGQGNFQRVEMPIFSNYLLRCDGGYLLIDTSYKNDYEKLIGGLDALGVKVSDIKYILLTHHHDDHTGLVAQLSGESGARILAHERAIRPLSKGENEPVIEPLNNRVRLFFFILRRLVGVSGFSPVIIGEEDIVVTGDDDRFLRSIGIDGKIICTPGHTKDSISVLLDDGNAFVGDAAMSSPMVAGIKYRPVYVENMDEVFSSWKRILAEGAQTIHPFHGKSFPAQRLGLYLTRHNMA